MSSPLNLSLCFTIVLKRISSVFEELISRPAFLDSFQRSSNFCSLLSTTNPTWTGLELNMGPLSDRPQLTARAMTWPFNNNVRWKRISDKVNKIEPCESACSTSVMILTLQWPPGVIPVLPHSDQVWHDAGDGHHWLLARRATVLGANGLPLWQVGRHLWACNRSSMHSETWHYMKMACDIHTVSNCIPGNSMHSVV